MEQPTQPTTFSPTELPKLAELPTESPTKLPESPTELSRETSVPLSTDLPSEQPSATTGKRLPKWRTLMKDKEDRTSLMLPVKRMKPLKNLAEEELEVQKVRDRRCSLPTEKHGKRGITDSAVATNIPLRYPQGNGCRKIRAVCFDVENYDF